MMKELHAVIFGRVQGVGFRATTRSFAIQLGLKGYVRNLGVDQVEIVAQGEKGKLLQLLEKLKAAFNGDYIEEIETDYRPIERRYEDFSIQIRSLED